MRISLHEKIFQLVVRSRDLRMDGIRNLREIFIFLRDRLRIEIFFMCMGIFKNKVSNFEHQFLKNCHRFKNISRGQIFQDIFALSVNQLSAGGFFVEFGATNGVKLSNTYALENLYDWRGILAEPGRGWKSELTQNRKAFIDNRCVYSRSGEQIEFTQQFDGQLSGITGLLEPQGATADRYLVTTVSLEHLLEEHKAPSRIEYLSIDTEGSEFEILEYFNFSKYRFNCLTIEHNFEQVKREKIRTLLEKNGYTRVLEKYSSHDDWYIDGELRNFSY